jgi:hypothetical protein
LSSHDLSYKETHVSSQTLQLIFSQLTVVIVIEIMF